jgi:anhydro-N-acetylmuramic acid kinase
MASGDPRHLYLGAISGTSVDGLDLALLEINDSIRFIAAETLPLPDKLRSRLLTLGQPENDNLDDLGTADAALGRFIAEAALEFLATHGVNPNAVRALGSHGQTVRHRPDQQHPFTWQIGDPNLIAELTGITTVADFRRRDMAAGGQGAPLVPRFHDALFRRTKESLAILNIGGISNLSLLPADASQAIIGFDCGPGNALMDSWCQQHQSRPFDHGGAWAATGTVIEPLLKDLLSDSYLQRNPPKSTGREHYNLRWLQPRLPASADPADVQRTLLELTAQSIREALHNWGSFCQRLVVCGGGRLNQRLLVRLAELADIPVTTSEDHGYDGDGIEAAAFAWLAQRRLDMTTGSAGSVTGADGDRILGGVYPGFRN